MSAKECFKQFYRHFRKNPRAVRLGLECGGETRAAAIAYQERERAATAPLRQEGISRRSG